MIIFVDYILSNLIKKYPAVKQNDKMMYIANQVILIKMNLNRILLNLIKHKHNYKNKLYNITMENEYHFLIKQCNCGKTNIKRVHKESII